MEVASAMSNGSLNARFSCIVFICRMVDFTRVHRQLIRIFWHYVVVGT